MRLHQIAPGLQFRAQSQPNEEQDVRTKMMGFAPRDVDQRENMKPTTPEDQFMSSRHSKSLEARRPMFLRDFIGNQPVVRRLSEEMKRGTVPRRAFIFGPTGSGKTTIVRIIAWHFFCRNRVGKGDPCGTCDRGQGNLMSLWEYNEWTGAHLEANWRWWEQNASTLLYDPSRMFFLDETQDLSPPHKKKFYDALEYASCVMIFATTHRNALPDALIKRFGANVFEMTRPSSEEVVALLHTLCQKQKVQAETELLLWVTQHYSCELRSCVDVVYTAARQAPGGIITQAFLEDVFQAQRPFSGGASQLTSLPKL
jgi:replication-associated recombination protein RarA